MRLLRCLLAGLLLGGILGVLTGIFVGWALANMTAYPSVHDRSAVAVRAALAWTALGTAGGLLVGLITWFTGRARRRNSAMRDKSADAP